MLVLGVNGFYKGLHDPAAALYRDGVLVVAIEEERCIREKHAFDHIPHEAIALCFQEAGINACDLDALAIGWEMDHLIAYSTGIPLIPISKETIREIYLPTSRYPETLKESFTITHLPHHQAHANESFFASGFEEAAILVIDGSSEYEGISLFHGSKQKGINKITAWPFEKSLGIFYQALTLACGFYPFQEGKVMGLASYESLSFTIPNAFDPKHPRPITWRPDQRECEEDVIKQWLEVFRSFKGIPESFTPFNWEDAHAQKCLATSGQAWLEEALIALIEEALKQLNLSHIVITGGVGLNCVANAKAAAHFKGRATLFISHAPSDMGVALGAAQHHFFTQGIMPSVKPSDVYSGVRYDSASIKKTIEAYDEVLDVYETPQIEAESAKRLYRGEIGGWFQGRMEFGPRALGNRSILASPLIKGVQKRLNRIKAREAWRPFAPSIKYEAVHDYFEADADSPYMSFAYRGKASALAIPEALHVDHTARVQTVKETMNPRYWRLLDAFEALSGVPMLLNTSFNIGPEPIVASPEDAIRSFIASELDFLVIEEMILCRR